MKKSTGRKVAKEAVDWEKLFHKMRHARKPVLPKDFCKRVDEKLQIDWVRRASLIFLERPFKEMTKKFEADRDAAVAFAGLSQLLPEAIERYKELASFLETAQLRIEMGLCVREDMQDIVEEAKRSTDAKAQRAVTLQ